MTGRKAWFRETKAAIVERDGPLCWICETDTVEGDRTLDHWQPKSLGGSDDLSNLRVVHAACNRRRGNTPPELTHAKPCIIKARQCADGAACITKPRGPYIGL